VRVITDKSKWLSRLNLTNEWPCRGLPTILHFDNALEFHGKMVRRACDIYGVGVKYRPLKTPEYGGGIERAIGSVLNKVHELKGTTFSNPEQLGSYDSEGNATFTLDEVEEILVDHITGVYHNSLHSGINSSPLAFWRKHTLGDAETEPQGLPTFDGDEERLKIDFSPYEERTIQTYGVELWNLKYYSDVLRPFVNREVGGRKPKYIFHYDPRDVTTLYFWNERVNQHFAIPLANSARPPASIWELRNATEKLKKDGLRTVDEQAIFETLERNRQREELAAERTKSARRENERRRRNADVEKPKTRRLYAIPSTDVSDAPSKVIKPYRIEDWDAS
jgi:putative transposase